MNGLPSRMVCSGCGAALEPDARLPFRCPRADELPAVDHVLTADLPLEGVAPFSSSEQRPFVRYRELLHTYRQATRAGFDDARWSALIDELDQSLRSVDGRGFARTPYAACAALAAELGLDPKAGGDLFIKDETGNVAGSHKARHLAGVALQLAVVDEPRATRLAIASCGNAALAAAVLARATERPLDAFVPPVANPHVLAALAAHGANIVVCGRSQTDPAGDPCLRRYREAVVAGALPFSVQGSENGLVIEGGSTLGLELAEQHAALRVGPLDRILVQVGGGALGSATVSALQRALALGIGQSRPRFHTVQPASTQPLARAWRTLARSIAARSGAASCEAWSDARLAGWLEREAPREQVQRALEDAAAHRARYMRPWEEQPHSVAYGILDDETYDWRVLVRAMLESGGWPLAASEEQLVRAHERARTAAGIEVCATGSAGLAGCYELAAGGHLGAHERVAVLFTGAQRGTPTGAES